MEPSAEISERDLFWDKNHARLSEAVFRIRRERPGHGYREVGEEEITEMFDEAREAGLGLDEFLLLCNRAYQDQWVTDDGEVYIETTEGDRRYNGERVTVLGAGQLPPGSEDFLRRAARG